MNPIEEETIDAVWYIGNFLSDRGRARDIPEIHFILYGKGVVFNTSDGINAFLCSLPRNNPSDTLPLSQGEAIPARPLFTVRIPLQFARKIKLIAEIQHFKAELFDEARKFTR